MHNLAVKMAVQTCPLPQVNMMQWNKKDDTFVLKRNELATLLDALTFPTMFKKLDKDTKVVVKRMDKKIVEYIKDLK